LLVLLLILTACGMPRDIEHTTEDVEERGYIRAGAVVRAADPSSLDGGSPAGYEADVVSGYAESLGVEVRWEVGSESELMTALEEGGLDIVVGGIESSSPWSKHVGLSAPISPQGTPHLVAAVRQGENRWLLGFERYVGARR